MLLEANYLASWDGSSGVAGGPWHIDCVAIHTAAYLQASTIASTLSFQLQTSPQTAGPWVTEASTSVSATGTATSQDVLRLVGPYEYARVYSLTKSTGTHIVRLIAVG